MLRRAMARTSAAGPRISALEGRRILLGGQELLAAPRRASCESVYEMVLRLGFVQIDSINVVERAHHLILGTRLSSYRPGLLRILLERQRRLFEHWTHDAAAIPTVWFPYWRHRFDRYRHELTKKRWWRERMGGDPSAVLARVRRSFELAGPLMARDLAAEATPEARGDGAWWGWSPQKAALEYLWWSGELAIAGRKGFNKLYDLTERVLPDAAGAPRPSAADQESWACRTALERLGAATAEEIAAFWKAIPAATVRGWCQGAAARGEVVAVTMEAVEGGLARTAFAVPDWAERARQEPASATRMRLLCPFDPAVRDRGRLRRLFGFDFRFEAFVPRDRRQHGYYVMPVLEGDRLVARIDPKLHRSAGLLAVRAVTWEAGIRPTRRRLAALDAAVGRLAKAVGASRWELPAG
jgi:uncharacterized protein YcaQ